MENIVKQGVVTNQQSEWSKNTLRIIKGSLFAIILSIILLFIFGLLLTYTEISENTIVPVVTTVVGISILIGSTISSRKIRKNGLVNGGLVGLIYVVILYLSSSLCITSFSLTISSFVMLGVGTVTGMIGGIIGVNLNRKS